MLVSVYLSVIWDPSNDMKCKDIYATFPQNKSAREISDNIAHVPKYFWSHFPLSSIRLTLNDNSCLQYRGMASFKHPTETADFL